LLLCALCWALPAWTQTALVVDPEQSELSYTGEALFHDWTGTSRVVGGRLVVDWDSLPSLVSLELSAPVASFDSGNGLRDGKMREVTRADRYPTVRFVADEAALLLWRSRYPESRGTWRLQGTLTFAGQSRPLTSDAAVTWDGTTLTASGSFDLNLDAYRVDRPSLLGQAIDETIRVRYRIVAQ
jgi:polyisoprenoid-binding protein YceI